MKLVTSLILSCFDYRNSILSGLHVSSVRSHRRIQNCAARPVQLTTTHLGFDFSTGSPSSKESSSVQYKRYKCITGTAPSYLCDCLQLYTPSRNLPASASDNLSLQILRTRLSTAGSRAFSVFGPSTWNDSPSPSSQGQQERPQRDRKSVYADLPSCHVKYTPPPPPISLSRFA